MNKVVLVSSSIFLSIILFSCTATKPINNQQALVVKNDTTQSITQATTQQPSLLNNEIFNNAHVGICVYEPATNTYLYNYQSNKYFIPASNTKIATCYAAMKYLGDSLLGLMYDTTTHLKSKDTIMSLIGTGDPTFLHPAFQKQPVFDYLKKMQNKQKVLLELGEPYKNNYIKSYGFGWSMDDYNESYMPQRSFFPIYGNVVTFSLENERIKITPKYFKYSFLYQKDSNSKFKYFKVKRLTYDNYFEITEESSKSIEQSVPIKFGYENKLRYSVEVNLLNDTLKQNIDYAKLQTLSFSKYKKIYSQPTDSLLKPMMHNSDNFFAEQTLLMVSLNQLGFMSDEKIIDTLLKTDFKNLPQKPKWVDGSGLSRYNLFTPQDFVFILNKMKNEFTWQRISTIFPTGDEGTLKGYYKKYQNKIFAKTGTISNNLALSGFIKANSGKDYIFSIIINNHQSSAADIRLAIEKFITEIIEKK